MKFYQRLQTKVKLPKNKLDLLPRSYHILGDILLVKLNSKLYTHRRKIGKVILEILPFVRSVVLIKGILGKKRVPQTEVIAGDKNTETIHREHGVIFSLDPRKVMFSKGNKFEKLRLLKKIRKKDVVVDMFAGIGYWSISLAKKARVFAIDINPVSIRYLEKNAFLNKVNFEILEGDCRKFSRLLRADKIIMGYFGTKKFFSYALQMGKRGSIIFYHDLVSDEKVSDLKQELTSIAKKQRKKIKFVSVRRVKTYSPGVSHYVFDIKVL